MAFTAAETLSITTITGIDRDTVEFYLTADSIDSDVETAVRTELTRWETDGANFTAIEPNERNFGARINPGNAKNDIRKNIALLLNMSHLLASGSRLVRC